MERELPGLKKGATGRLHVHVCMCRATCAPRLVSCTEQLLRGTSWVGGKPKPPASKHSLPGERPAVLLANRGIRVHY